MKIILTKDVNNLGAVGDVVTVKSGYARNFLFPNKLAILFSEKQHNAVKVASQLEERKLERKKDDLIEVIGQIKALELSMKMKSEDGEKLFGSVTKQDLSDLLKENGIEVDKKFINLDNPIKTLGNHEVEVVFTKDVSGSFSILIEKED
tara:strand:+ start:298 stop:744 length:447 start_codon:yes stop_codon:yes gene_type:complete